MPGDATTDGQREPDSNPPACDVTKPFGAPTRVAGVDTGGDEASAWFAADKRTIYFSRRISSGSDFNIYRATRAQLSEPFTGVVQLAGVNTASEEDTPVLTADELQIFFWSLRSTSVDIFQATRSSVGEDFGNVVPVDGVNTPQDDATPWISEDGLTIYYTSTVDGPFATYRSTRANVATAFTPPVKVELSSVVGTGNPVVSRDGLEIFFHDYSSSRDVWHALRMSTSESFGEPRALTELSSATSLEFPSWISPDRCELMFASNRDDIDYNIWIATRPR